ncbi:hypothetical protein [Vallitalea okinawensis]|uniref:hypothetical protein n=1 Tax=Vallitalea okinawensis TaxID=2078660 RepID=UPI000CFBB16A|nr:hypothetical protein [Vallitalea okinawensis]
MKNRLVKSMLCSMLIGTISTSTVSAEVFSVPEVEVRYVSSITEASKQNTTCSAMEKNEIDLQALEIMQKTGNWSYVEPLFPSMTSQGVEEVVALYIQKTGNYEQAEAALPYMNQDHLENNQSTQSQPYTDYYTMAIEVVTNTGDIYSAMVYVSFLSTEQVDLLVKDYIDKSNDFSCIYAIRPYMSTNGIDDTVKSYIDQTGDYGIVAAMLQFMSSEASDYVARKYISEDKEQLYLEFFTPYLETEIKR